MKSFEKYLDNLEQILNELVDLIDVNKCPICGKYDVLVNVIDNPIIIKCTKCVFIWDGAKNKLNKEACKKWLKKNKKDKGKQ
jgi:hypothetical protein